MALSKYTEETLDRIRFKLKETGSDKDAYNYAGISNYTYYTWIKEKPNFSNIVKEAKLEWQNSLPNTMRVNALVGLGKYLSGNPTLRVKTEEVLDLNGYVIGEKRTVIETERLPPRWAIERVLGKHLDIVEAMLTLNDAGMADEEEVRIIAEGFDQIKQNLQRLRLKRAEPNEQGSQPLQGQNR